MPAQPHRPSLHRLLVPVAIAAALLARPAQGQVQITFYETKAATAPDPSLPYAGGSVLCTANAAGSANGFSLNFADAAAVNAICGSINGNPASDRINVSNSFGARIVGSLTAPAAGLYEFFVNADDGDVVTVNGITYHSDWNDKGGGPGTIGNVALNLGANPFVVDYYQGPCCGAFITVEARGNVQIAPPNVVPEPATLLLAGAGLAVLGAGARLRRVA